MVVDLILSNFTDEVTGQRMTLASGLSALGSVGAGAAAGLDPAAQAALAAVVDEALGHLSGAPLPTPIAAAVASLLGSAEQDAVGIAAPAPGPAPLPAPLVDVATLADLALATQHDVALAVAPYISSPYGPAWMVGGRAEPPPPLPPPPPPPPLGFSRFRAGPPHPGHPAAAAPRPPRAPRQPRPCAQTAIHACTSLQHARFLPSRAERHCCFSGLSSQLDGGRQAQQGPRLWHAAGMDESGR